MYGYRVVSILAHDPLAYTQGLLYREGFLYESVGQYGKSGIRKVRLETGEVLKQQAIAKTQFGEGLTDWGNTLVQLTWKDGLGFVYDRSSLSRKSQFGFLGEGWGLAHDYAKLILSDGSSTLRFLDPKTFREIGRIAVKDRGTPVAHLNELEFVKGEIYANVWQTNRIARIDPANGQVTGWIDLTGLLPEVLTNPEAVLNGIAYDAVTDRLWVTGKLWPKLFEIQLLRR